MLQKPSIENLLIKKHILPQIFSNQRKQCKIFDILYNILKLIILQILQVLELGILVHSVIIGISLGTTENPKTIKPLIIALSFHQFFEGMGLGGCISQVKLVKYFNPF